MERKSIKEKKEEYKKANSNYFEGVLQIRDFSEEQFNEIIDYIEDNECRIAKHIKQKNGVDLFLSSQKFIQKLSRWIKNRYNCQIKLTRTLHTRDTKANKDLYRMTLFVQFLKHKAGDVIEYEGEKIKITSLGKKPSGKVLSTGKRMFLEARLMR